MKRLSLHIGLNHIDPDVYGPGNDLENCLNDCDSYQDIARRNNFMPTVIKDHEATAARVTAELSQAASVLNSGDYFLVTYAGHGSQVPDEDNEEDDGMNETWVLYDRQMVDNEIYRMWSKFKPGVKIFVISDSCHSGTLMRPFMKEVKPQITNISPLSRNFKTSATLAARRTTTEIKQDIVRQIRAMATERDLVAPKSEGMATREGQKDRLLNPAVSLENYVHNRELYRNFMLLAGSKRDIVINASLLYISGCQDNQKSGDGPKGTHGTFTGHLLEVWDNGAFTGVYYDFYTRIGSLMPSVQTPNYMKLGPANIAYEKEKPFVGSLQSTGTGNTGGNGVTGNTNGTTKPSLQIASQWKKSDGAPLFQVNKGGNSLYYVELATDNSLFNRAANGSQRNASNFYASYQDSNNYENGSFLNSKTPYQLPNSAWQNLNSANRIYYRVGSASDLKWNDFKVSFDDKDYLNAPGFTVVSQGSTINQPGPLGGGDNGNGNSGNTGGGGGSDSSVSISDSVGQNGRNKKEDVKCVQSLLNKVPSDQGGVDTKLVVDGLFGKKTLNAIKGFQMYYGYDNGGDFGIILPGSDTFNELVSKTTRSLAAPTVRDKNQLEEVSK